MPYGIVRLGFLVWLDPSSEFYASHWYGPPQSSYVKAIEDQLDMVEEVVAGQDAAGWGAVAHNRDELRATLEAGKVALVHCVEGGFQLGGTDEEIERTVARLAGRGVVYVTLAHLFWRRVATNANAFPFLTDKRYSHWFPEPSVGLTHRGKAAVRAMARNRILIDLTHMSERAIVETLELLDEQDRELGRVTPVLSTHMATRQGPEGLAYNITRESVEK